MINQTCLETRLEHSGSFAFLQRAASSITTTVTNMRKIGSNIRQEFLGKKLLRHFKPSLLFVTLDGYRSAEIRVSLARADPRGGKGGFAPPLLGQKKERAERGRKKEKYTPAKN